MPTKVKSKPAKKPAPAAKPVARKVAVAPVAKPAKPAPAAKATKAAKPAKAVKPAKAAPAAVVAPIAPAPAPKTVKGKKPAKTGPKKGRGRVTSPSGPLSTAVVAVLKRFKRPLSCREITEALLKKGYVFTHPEPKRILSIRIYKLKGVKKVSAGRFTYAE
ncbi:MAG TPA: hypothetical protein VIT91_21775 [Chthoniobacterales bacterium]